MNKISTKSLSLCAMSLSFLGCAQPDELSATTSQPLTSGVKRAATGGACTAAGDDAAAENDCLTIKNSWGGAGAGPSNHNNGGNKLVYTGIDINSPRDQGLIASEKSFAEGFRTAGGKAQGGVYGAHGDPGWIQGLPPYWIDEDAGEEWTILHETFGATEIPKLGLSVCWAGNTGADSGQFGATPRTYVNNLSAANWISIYYEIPASAITACKNGEVRPSEGVLWCLQEKQQRDGWAKPKLLGNAMLVDGNGLMRGAASDTDDFSYTMQAEGPDDDEDGRPDYPARYFKARNLARKRGRGAEPWDLDKRCEETCIDGECSVLKNYPAFQTLWMCLAQPEAGGSSAVGDVPAPGGCDLVDISLAGRFLTPSIVIEQPDGSMVPVSGATASPDGKNAHFTFTPTQDGTHYIWVTDEDGLYNDPHDPEFYMNETFTVILGSDPNPDPIPDPNPIPGPIDGFRKTTR